MKLPSYSFLIPAALLLGLAPFTPEPHLFEKVRMLFSGTLSKPIDIFDLFLHGALPALLVVKALKDARARIGNIEGGKAEGSSSAPSSEAPKTRSRRRREERQRKGEGRS
jgi:hypothetical protein